MVETRYWSWSRTSGDGQWRLTSISVYEDKIYERWEKMDSWKQSKADPTKNYQHSVSPMPRGWLKHAKESYKRDRGMKNAKSKLVNTQHSGMATESA